MILRSAFFALAALAGAAPALAQDPHAGHAGHTAPSAPQPAPPTSALADELHDPVVMALERARLRQEHGGGHVMLGRFEQLELRPGAGLDGYAWEGRILYGGDIDRLAVKSEGEGDLAGDLQEGEAQLLWSHAIAPYFDVQAGVRQDLEAGSGDTYVTLGVSGLAPYWFETDAALFLSDRGDVAARFEGAYDLRITQRLVLEPRGELNLGPRRTGGTTLEAGLRLRYEISRAFAPYIGVEHAHDLRNGVGDTYGAVGLRLAF